jgi:general secretion pathway protein H
VEILVVLILIGITVSLVTLSIGTAGAGQAEQEARRLAALIGVASEEAVLKSEEVGVFFRPDGYEFYFLAPDNTWKRPDGTDDVLRARTLPSGFILAASVEGMPLRFEKPKEQQPLAPHAYLLSSGERSPFEVELGPAGGVHYRVHVPVLGEITVTPIEAPVARR